MTRDDTTNQLGKRIRQLRNAAGLSQSIAARHVGVTRHTWQRWESGDMLPNALRIPTIASALDASIAALYTPDDTTAIADVIITSAALERVTAQGQPAIDELTARLTNSIAARLTAAASRGVAATNGSTARARSRHASKRAERERLRLLDSSKSRRRRDRRLLPELTAE
jgi:transcriptional regulator with XRE-family HTH domain